MFDAKRTLNVRQALNIPVPVLVTGHSGGVAAGCAGVVRRLEVRAGAQNHEQYLRSGIVLCHDGWAPQDGCRCWFVP
jgi:hypothetical protein